MNTFFPKHAVQWHFHEPTVLRRFTLSLWEMALLTGLLLRLYRSMLINYGSTSWLWFGAVAVGMLVLCAMATVHIANYPVRQWLWRAPLFALVEVAAESVASLALIAFSREPSGTARAEWSDWFPMIVDTLWTRELMVCGWALVLAGAVSIVRHTILRNEAIEEPTGDSPIG